MEYLDGPRKGERVSFQSETQVTLPVWPVKVRFTANDYQPLDFVFDESTVAEGFPSFGMALFWIRMAFAPRPDTDAHVGVISPGLECRVAITYPH